MAAAIAACVCAVGCSGWLRWYQLRIQKPPCIHPPAHHEQARHIHEDRLPPIAITRRQRAVERGCVLVHPSATEARQHANQQHAHPGQAPVQLRHDGGNPRLGRPRPPMQMAEIIGPDQHHRRARMDAHCLTVFDAPKQMRRRIAFEAHVERVAAIVIMVPCRREIRTLPVLGDAVAIPHQIDAPGGADLGSLLRQPRPPPGQVRAGERYAGQVPRQPGSHEQQCARKPRPPHAHSIQPALSPPAARQ